MQTAQLRRRNFLFLLGDNNGIGFFLIDLAAQISFIVLRIREEQDLHIIKRDILSRSAQMTLLILAAIQRALSIAFQLLFFFKNAIVPESIVRSFEPFTRSLKLPLAGSMGMPAALPLLISTSGTK